MIEHPVPQNITEYQFHLIGNMTIKQFLILLVGVMLSFLFYSTNLPSILKWPFIFVFVAGSAAVAFVPYEERTLDQWLVNFVRAIYRPTKFYWRRLAIKPEYFSYTNSSTRSASSSIQTGNQPLRNKQVSEYLSSLQSQKTSKQPDDPLDLFDDENPELTSLFDSVAAASNVTPGTERAMEKPDLQVRTRPLGSKRGMVFSTATPAQKQEELTKTPAQSGSARFRGTDTTSISHAPTFTMEPAQPQKSAPQKQGTPNHPNGNAHTTTVKQVSVEKVETKKETDSKKDTAAKTPVKQKSQPSNYTDQVKRVSTTEKTTPAIFNKNLPFPSLPDKPNLFLGMVHDQQKNIIPGAIVEILDQNGNTVRAMKTNNLGQFYISTPLKKGHYTIETEANDHTFPVYTLEVNDTVLDPVDIQAA